HLQLPGRRNHRRDVRARAGSAVAAPRANRGGIGGGVAPPPMWSNGRDRRSWLAARTGEVSEGTSRPLRCGQSGGIGGGCASRKPGRYRRGRRAPSDVVNQAGSAVVARRANRGGIGGGVAPPLMWSIVVNQ